MSARWARVHRSSSTVIAILTVFLLIPATRGVSQEYTARAGDVLDILVIGEPDLTRLATVSPEGNIFLPLVGNVYVAGLTSPQIERRLKETLSRFIKDPQILVTFRQTNTEKEFVYVLGQVQRPGPYEYRRGWTVAELLAIAGGPTSRAAMRRALVMRRVQAMPVDLEKLMNGETGQNVELKPGDVLIVPEINERVLVLGEVVKPGYLDLKDGDRVVDVLTKAGGPTIKAAPERILVMRDGQALRINLEAFLKAGAPEDNPPIIGGDVVVVPETDRRVLVMGEVEKPGPYPLTNNGAPERVLDLIMRAGGPKRGANLTRVMVVRQNGEMKGVELNISDALKGGAADQNIPVKPGDVIFVPAGFSVQLRDVLDMMSGVRLLRVFFGLP